MFAVVALFCILAFVLLGPFLVKPIEEHLELFLFAMGALAVSVASLWSWPLAVEGLTEPIKISAAVLAAGSLFKLLKPYARKAVEKGVGAIGIKSFAFLVVVLLGLVSSVVTAIVASLLLVEVIDCLRLDRRDEVRLVVLSCFAIGVGAVLTPLGEPLATIVIAKLQGEPYRAGFWFLAERLWLFVVPGVLVFGALAAVFVGDRRDDPGLAEEGAETWGGILLRAGKTYLFVMALVLLGSGFKPIVDAYIAKLPAAGLFWINTVSAILDNATLAAAEIGPAMSPSQLAASLLGLTIAGGMLIPGNIPNIVSAGKLGIRSREWARFGLPVGFAAMAACFGALLALGLL